MALQSELGREGQGLEGVDLGMEEMWGKDGLNPGAVLVLP